LEQLRQVLAIPFQKTDIRLVRHLTQAEMQAILDAPDPNTRDGVRDRAMLHLAFTSGLRVSELVGLKLGDVTFRACYVDIHVMEREEGARPYPVENCCRQPASVAFHSRRRERS